MPSLSFHRNSVVWSQPMLRALGIEARLARTDAGLTQQAIVKACDASPARISRFEAGVQVQDLEHIIKCYEDLCELPGGTLWQRAVERAFG